MSMIAVTASASLFFFAMTAVSLQDSSAVMGLVEQADRLFGQKQYQDAVLLMDRAIQIDSSVPDPYEVRMITLFYQGRYEESLQDGERLAALAPSNYFGWYWRGGALSKLKRDTEAVPAYSEAIRLGMRRADVYNARGFSLTNIGSIREALADYGEALRLDPRYVSAFNNRGYAYLMLGWYDQAIVDLSTALTLDADYSSSYALRATCYLRLKRFPEASRDIFRAVTLDPWNHPSFISFAQILEGAAEVERNPSLRTTYIEAAAAHRRRASRFEYLLYLREGNGDPREFARIMLAIMQADREVENPDPITDPVEVAHFNLFKFFAGLLAPADVVVGLDRTETSRLSLYIGLDYFLRGDLRTAKSWVRHAVDDGAPDTFESVYARSVYSRMNDLAE